MTELIWDGKYDANGKKTAPVRIALPFQNIETVNESTEDRKRVLDMFASGKPNEWRNRLIWGDKKYVLPSLLHEFAGKVNLIYIDPPFDTGADFSFTAQIPDNPDTDYDEATSFTKQPSMIEQKAYRDTWGRGLDSYLQWFYETAILLRELMAEDGSIYVHLDWHVGHYGKVILDEVLGQDKLRNEIIWCYQGPGSPGMKQFNRKHDNIFWYSKSDTWTFNDKEIRIAHDEKTRENFKAGLKGSGFVSDTYDLNMKGKVPESWWEMAIAARYPIDGIKRTGYATEKPWPLLERIIKASSNEGDLVLDCFCGSGTTAAVAEKLGRRWITCDLGRFAIHTARKRLLGIPGVKPFNVQNLGKYERQQWMEAELEAPPFQGGVGVVDPGEGRDSKSTPHPPLKRGAKGVVVDPARMRAEQERTYRNFILDLYHGTPIDGYSWLHGTKAGRMIHIGAVDSPVAVGDIKSIVQEFWKTAGKSKDIKTNGIDVLGWDFAFDINETAQQIAAEHKIDLKTKKIPREVLEKKAVEQGDIKFYELAYLNVKTKAAKKKLSLELKDFIVPPDDIPQEVLGHITHWSQWIDYWAVDWDFKGDTFHNQWQSYRTKKSPQIDLKVEHDYETTGKYLVMVKVIDILGNDTTKQIEVGI